MYARSVLQKIVPGYGLAALVFPRNRIDELGFLDVTSSGRLNQGVVESVIERKSIGAGKHVWQNPAVTPSNSMRNIPGLSHNLAEAFAKAFLPVPGFVPLLAR